MAGLVPAIHAFSFGGFIEDVDAWHKAGHDGGEISGCGKSTECASMFHSCPRSPPRSC
jgi:hypothetical protein